MVHATLLYCFFLRATTAADYQCFDSSLGEITTLQYCHVSNCAIGRIDQNCQCTCSNDFWLTHLASTTVPLYFSLLPIMR